MNLNLHISLDLAPSPVSGQGQCHCHTPLVRLQKGYSLQGAKLSNVSQNLKFTTHVAHGFLP